jgi:hypothetical protein
MQPVIPTYNNQIVGQGLARLTSAFITKPNVRAMLAVYLQPWQDLEDATWGVLTGRFLASAPVYQLPQTNFVFDVLGALIGEARGSLSDAQLKALIYLRVAVNRSTGRVTDWSRFAQILAPFCDDVPYFLDDAAATAEQAVMYFGCWNLQLPPNTVAQTLARAMANGVYGHFHYSTWPDGNDFEFGSRYDGTAGQGTWGSRYDPTVGGLWVAGAALS